MALAKWFCQSTRSITHYHLWISIPNQVDHGGGGPRIHRLLQLRNKKCHWNKYYCCQGEKYTLPWAGLILNNPVQNLGGSISLMYQRSIAVIRVSQEKCNCFTSKLQKGQLCENCIGDYHKVHGFFHPHKNHHNNLIIASTYPKYNKEEWLE